MIDMWQPVVVTWNDAYSTTICRSRDLVKHKLDQCIRRTIGFVLRDDDENIVVCMEDDRDAQEAAGSDDDCENVTVIPRAMIVKIEELAVRRGAVKRAGDE